ncbi:cell wall-associated NlpC family hydrolase [Frondihabitans sp. PhB188]|uniref:C40 family peptidase n=1 Tax=Frondihabitans sp. PhB188 TaxID=2485200 RepID=UPI000F4AA574|nr:C40 family peptidase [Frondihabitans sp. PhB188]ROQ38748.1 cell wall-associated NlpC family hydrolase [Frondihabitans sp. PhB188]
MSTGITTTPRTTSFVASRSTPRTDPIRTGPVTTVTADAVVAPVTRRAARAADKAQAKAAASRHSMKRTVASVGALTLVAGLLGTMALPAFAHTPGDSDSSSASTAAVNAVRANGSQSVSVASGVKNASLSRDGYTTTVPVAPVVQTTTTTTATTLSTTETAASTAQRASFAASTAYTGKTAADYLASPSHPAFSLAAVYQTALQYQGTPYVFGGATPSGFDCSGFVMYVYAQYGISLAHSVPAQSAAGTIISEADAEPGDVVVLNNGSHDGFYAGNGMILDAPKPGGVVSVRPLWTTDVHFVRFGIK